MILVAPAGLGVACHAGALAAARSGLVSSAPPSSNAGRALQCSAAGLVTTVRVCRRSRPLLCLLSNPLAAGVNNQPLLAMQGSVIAVVICTVTHIPLCACSNPLATGVNNQLLLAMQNNTEISLDVESGNYTEATVGVLFFSVVCNSSKDSTKALFMWKRAATLLQWVRVLFCAARPPPEPDRLLLSLLSGRAVQIIAHPPNRNLLAPPTYCRRCRGLTAST